MATVSESHTTDRALSDVEFEELLQKTYEMVQSQKSPSPAGPVGRVNFMDLDGTQTPSKGSRKSAFSGKTGRRSEGAGLGFPRTDPVVRSGADRRFWRRLCVGTFNFPHLVAARSPSKRSGLKELVGAPGNWPAGEMGVRVLRRGITEDWQQDLGLGSTDARKRRPYRRGPRLVRNLVLFSPDGAEEFVAVAVHVLHSLRVGVEVHHFPSGVGFVGRPLR